MTTHGPEQPSGASVNALCPLDLDAFPALNRAAFIRWLAYLAEKQLRTPHDPTWSRTTGQLTSSAEGLSKYSTRVQAEIIRRAISSGARALHKLSPEDAAAIDRPMDQNAAKLEAWIRRKVLPVTRKQILQRGPACVRRAADANAALHILLNTGKLYSTADGRFVVVAAT